MTYHPAFLLRDPRQKGEAWKDLQMVMAEFGLKAGPRGSFRCLGGCPPSHMYPGPNGFRFIGLAPMAFGKIVIVEGLQLK